jgi:hypothetical protein
VYYSFRVSIYRCITNGLNIWKISIVAFSVLFYMLSYTLLVVGLCVVEICGDVAYMGLAIARVSN